MFIHIGGTTVIRAKEIVAIFSTEISDASPDTVTYLQHAREVGDVEVIEPEETKSVIVTKRRVYFSPVSPLTLKRRVMQQENDDMSLVQQIEDTQS